MAERPPLPAPPIGPEVDLRGYGFMPLYGHHLFGSEFNARASDTAWRAGVTLWWASWNQVPAGSLPDDDVALCRLADLGRDVRTWKKLRSEALHGFELCSDGRLYHQYLCQLASEAWDRRVRERERKARYRASRDRRGDGDTTGTSNGTGTSIEQGRNGRQGQGEGQRQGKELSPPQPPSGGRASAGDGDTTGTVPRGTSPPGDERRESWLAVRAKYPAAPHEDWIAAEHHAVALVASGQATWAELEAGVARYARHCRATGRLVADPGRWFARADRPWASAWSLPEPGTGRGGLTEAARRWGEDEPEVPRAVG